MKHFVIATVAAGQLLAAAQPVHAARLDRVENADTRAGAFAGVRLRIALGGPERAAPRLDLTVAPLVQSRAADGRIASRFGEGANLNFGSAGPSLSVGGLPLAGRLAAVEEGERKKSSTGKKVLKGAAVVAIVAVALVGGAFLAYSIACADNRCSE